MCGLNNMRIYIELASYQPVFKLSSYPCTRELKCYSICVIMNFFFFFFQLAFKNDNQLYTCGKTLIGLGSLTLAKSRPTIIGIVICS